VVVEALENDVNIPTIFAGDFNTWTDRHLEAVTEVLESVGFQNACSWEYPGRNFPLDRVFLRHLELVKYEVIQCSSDHRGALLEISM
jgi:endonuclease/exonuclease/phosphatase (EEP) superfamily protein YafD